MDDHCKGCKFHSNAGHPKNHRYAKFNDWCCKYGRLASKAIGHCKNSCGKQLKSKEVT